MLRVQNGQNYWLQLVSLTVLFYCVNEELQFHPLNRLLRFLLKGKFAWVQYWKLSCQVFLGSLNTRTYSGISQNSSERFPCFITSLNTSAFASLVQLNWRIYLALCVTHDQLHVRILNSECFYMTSPKFRPQNYWSYWDFTFMMYKNSWTPLFTQIFSPNGFYVLW